jgi:hypothetical protein
MSAFSWEYPKKDRWWEEPAIAKWLEAERTEQPKQPEQPKK